MTDDLEFLQEQLAIANKEILRLQMRVLELEETVATLQHNIRVRHDLEVARRERSRVAMAALRASRKDGVLANTGDSADVS